MHTARTTAARAALLGLTLLTACGGGAAPPDIEVTFGQPEVRASTFADASARSAALDVTLSPDLSPGDRVVVFQSAAVFDLAGMTISDLGGGHYAVDLPIAAGLSVGTHTGQLSMLICRDVACGQPYRLSRSSIAYTVTVAERTGARITYLHVDVRGVSWDDTTGRTAGLLFTVTPPPAAAPTVEVLDGGGLFKAGVAHVSPQPDGSYAAFLPYPDSVPAGNYAGSAAVRICADAACTEPYALPQADVPYDVTIYHVEAGLPPLTATLALDGAAAAGVVEGVNAAGARTYALAAKVGQVITVTPSEPPLLISRAVDTVTLSWAPTTYPTIGYAITGLAAGATSGSVTITIRVADGRRIYLTLHVTP